MPACGRFGAEWIHKVRCLISARPAWVLLRVQEGFSEAHKAEETRVWDFPGGRISSWNWPVLPSMARC